MKRYLLIFIMLGGCGLFETRSPEAPDTGQLSFPPATSISILVDNFQKSISEKRIDNYMDCFLSETENSFSFSASPDVYASFPSYFERWSSETERRYFQSLISYISSDEKIALDFANMQNNFISPDSTLMLAEYSLTLPIIGTSIDSKYAGKIQLTLVPTESGIWKISRWIDSPNSSQDTTFPTWSRLKAHFFN